MNHEIDETREREPMIWRLDNLWYRVLGVVNGWVVRRARAHNRRELLRRFGRHVAWQKAHLN